MPEDFVFSVHRGHTVYSASPNLYSKLTPLPITMSMPQSDPPISSGEAPSDMGARSPHHLHFTAEKTHVERLSGLPTTLTQTSSSSPLSHPGHHPHTTSTGICVSGSQHSHPRRTRSSPSHQDAKYVAGNHG